MVLDFLLEGQWSDILWKELEAGHMDPIIYQPPATLLYDILPDLAQVLAIPA
jgi:hypothetical protein